MAARNTTISCPQGVATKISNGTAANARVVSPQGFWLLATAADSAPTSYDGGVPMLPHSILAADLALSDLFPGVTGPYHLWAWPTAGGVEVSISHA